MSQVPWRLAGKAIQGIKLGGLARRPVSKGVPEGEAKEGGMGRVHVVTVDSSEVLYLPGGGDAVDLKKRCEARDAQSSGSPSSLVFDETEALFVADFAKRAIISQRPAQPVVVRACVRACARARSRATASRVVAQAPGEVTWIATDGRGAAGWGGGAV